MALTTTAHAQTPTLVVPPLAYDYPYHGTPLSRALPPAIYDRPYTAGELTISEASQDHIRRECNRPGNRPIFGCTALRHWPDGRQECWIWIAPTAEIEGFGPGWTREIVLRHEIGHCNGWPNDHAGARPMNAKPALGPPPPEPQLEQPAKAKAPPEKLLNASVPTGKRIDLNLAAALMERGQIWAAERDKEITAAK